jgi:hypothetical protein
MKLPTSVVDGTSNVALKPRPSATKSIPKKSNFKRLFVRGFLAGIRRCGVVDVDLRGAGFDSGI